MKRKSIAEAIPRTAAVGVGLGDGCCRGRYRCRHREGGPLDAGRDDDVVYADLFPRWRRPSR